MKLKTIKAIITNDFYIPINRNVNITWQAGDIENVYLDDGEMQGTLKNTELVKYFKEFIKPSKEEILEMLAEHMTRSVTGELIKHNEVDSHGAPSWSSVYNMTPLVV